MNSPLENRTFRITIMSILLLLFSVLLYISPSSDERETSSSPQFGTQDFAVYWMASRIFKEGGNPYEAGPILAMAKRLDLYQDDRFLYFAPPWVLTILAPVTLEDLPTSVYLWSALNAIVALLCGLLTAKIYARGSVPPILWVAGVLTFFPILKTLQTGNLGILILGATLLIHLELKRGHNFRAGMLLTMLLLKPHLTYLYSAALAIRIVTERRLSACAGFLTSFGALLYATHLLNPHIFTRWQGLLAAPGNALAWRTPTFGTFLRAFLLQLTGQLASWPGFLISVVSLAGLGVWLLRERFCPNWDRALPTLLALSLITAPYSWSTDHSLLLPIQCATLIISRQTSATAFRLSLSRLGAIQILQVFLYVLIPEEYSIVFPLLFIYVWWSLPGEIEAARSSPEAK
jgi:hypothetical protein